MGNEAAEGMGIFIPWLGKAPEAAGGYSSLYHQFTGINSSSFLSVVQMQERE